MIDFLHNAADLALVIFGFGMVIVIHELGHFLAARWAGVRVHEFAVGFGPALFSFRKGLGFRRGSSASEYARLLKSESEVINPHDPASVSPTEYRLNYFPLGGYVKMLGQDDTDPSAVSNAPDSYTSKPVWKRLVIISAGVLSNVVLAAAIFVVVFMVGLSEPPAILGDVVPGSPAATASPIVGAKSGMLETGLRQGLQPGDRILSIGGDRVSSFQDVFAAAAMAKRDRALLISAERPGVPGVIDFEIKPKEGERSHLLELGVTPATSTTLFEAPKADADRKRFRELLDKAGLTGVEPGMTLVSVNNKPVEYFYELTRAMGDSHGAEVSAVFRDAAGRSVSVSLKPKPLYATAYSPVPGREKTEKWPVTHLLGLAPPLMVDSLEEQGSSSGLREGDIFAQVGAVEWPNAAQAIAEIRRHAGQQLDLLVMRDNAYQKLSPNVDSQGHIGFAAAEATDRAAVATRPPESAPGVDSEAAANSESQSIGAAERLALPPGAVIASVDGGAVSNYPQLREALMAATQRERSAGEGAAIPITFRMPFGDTFAAGPIDRAVWTLTAGDVAALHALGWGAPISEALFKPARAITKAENPVQALAMGAAKTRGVVVMTYLTIVRLFEGSVHVEHLKGPVGIAHLGAQFADQGFIALLFFLGVISANLAVLNFLPLPIVDGGHVVFLLIEWITRKPVSVAVQNVATIAGLLILGCIFLVVTFNDIAAIFTG